jgi:hypothetical protein
VVYGKDERCEKYSEVIGACFRILSEKWVRTGQIRFDTYKYIAPLSRDRCLQGRWELVSAHEILWRVIETKWAD